MAARDVRHALQPAVGLRNHPGRALHQRLEGEARVWISPFLLGIEFLFHRADTLPVALAIGAGVGALTFSFVGPEQAKQYVDLYYETLEKECIPFGYAVNPQIAIACPFLILKDDQKALALGAESYGFFIYGLGHYSFFGEHIPNQTDIWREYKNDPKEFANPEGRLQDCVGSPDRVRAQLREFEKVGIDHVICLSQAGNIPHEILCESIELFGKEVLPEFKERDQKNAAKKAAETDRLNNLLMPNG